MDPSTYQQLMVSQLMGQGTAAPGTGGQNATSPYGQAFITGNQSMPQQQQAGMLGTPAPSNVLQQPMQSYASA